MKSIYQLLAISLAVKLILAILLPMTPDESYYWVWSQNLQLSYYDHPPMIAWLFYLGDFLPKALIKFPAILINQLGLLGFVYFLKELDFNTKQISNWCLLALATPLIGIAGVVMTPDLPLLAFIPWCALFFQRSLRTSKIADYLGFGIFLGLSLLSKYHAVLFIFGVMIFLISSRTHRSQLNWAGVGVSVLASLAVFSPVVIWNYQNEWASFTFQAKHGLSGKKWEANIPLAYILGQLMLITPLMWKATFNRKLLSNKLLLILTTFPFIFFLMTSFRGHVELNWTNIAFPFLIAVWALDENFGWTRKTYFAGWLLALALVTSHWLYPWIPTKNHKLNEPVLYKPIFELAQNYQPFYAGSYQMASIVSWNQHQVINKLPGIRRYDFFDRLITEDQVEDKFYLVKESWVEFPQWVEANYQKYLIQMISEDFEFWVLAKK